MPITPSKTQGAGHSSDNPLELNLGPFVWTDRRGRPTLSHAGRPRIEFSLPIEFSFRIEFHLSIGSRLPLTAPIEAGPPTRPTLEGIREYKGIGITHLLSNNLEL